MNPVKKSNLNALAEALNPAVNNNDTVGGIETAADFLNALLSEPDKKKRRQMMKEFSERHKDAAKFIEENEDIINAEAEAALIRAAVGTVVTEKEVSYKGGRRIVSTKHKRIPPNVAALNLYLKNKLPDKYSDKPQTEIEIEDVSEIEEDIYGGKQEVQEKKNHTV